MAHLPGPSTQDAARGPSQQSKDPSLPCVGVGDQLPWVGQAWPATERHSRLGSAVT